MKSDDLRKMIKEEILKELNLDTITDMNHVVARDKEIMQSYRDFLKNIKMIKKHLVRNGYKKQQVIEYLHDAIQLKIDY